MRKSIDGAVLSVNAPYKSGDDVAQSRHRTTRSAMAPQAPQALDLSPDRQFSLYPASFLGCDRQLQLTAN
ncbi:MAG: hypothetical protein ACFKPT_25605 [Gloeotrichia echinulata GP01]